jgi:ATP-dependent protease ClpP protease subunit
VVQFDTERDFWLGPEEAIEYGVVDAILTGRALEAVSSS